MSLKHVIVKTIDSKYILHEIIDLFQRLLCGRAV